MAPALRHPRHAFSSPSSAPGRTSTVASAWRWPRGSRPRTAAGSGCPKPIAAPCSGSSCRHTPFEYWRSARRTVSPAACGIVVPDRIFRSVGQEPFADRQRERIRLEVVAVAEDHHGDVLLRPADDHVAEALALA